MNVANYTPTNSGPADYGWSVTPSDTLDLIRPTRAIKAATSGTVAWQNMAGDAQASVIDAGELLPIKARRILATGTTATGITALA